MLPYLLRNTSKKRPLDVARIFSLFFSFLFFLALCLVSEDSVAAESTESSLILQLDHYHVQARGAAAYYLGEKEALSANAKFALLRATKDSSEEVRAAAVRALAKHQVPEGLAALGMGLQESPWPFILDYVEAFGAYGATAISLTDACIGLFAHDKGVVREAAAKALAKVGPKVIPALLRAIQLTDQRDRFDGSQDQIARYSFRALSYLGKQAQSAVPTLQAITYKKDTVFALLRDITLLRIGDEVDQSSQ